VNALTELTTNPTVAAVVGTVAGIWVGALGTVFAPKVMLAFEQRYIDPKRRHRKVFSDQAAWLEERAQRLTVFAHQLREEPEADKYKLALLVSRLDQFDQKWAMKHTDIGFLISTANEKNKECIDNVAECVRNAEEVSRTMLWD
jgi:hypothetical protein